MVSLAVLLVALGGRLVWLQLVAGPAYARAALEQRNREIEIPPQRGSIYDREGEPLAVTMAARTIYAVPPVVVDPDGAAVALASILGGDVEHYRTQLTRDSSFSYIARKVDIERAEAVEALGLAGVYTQEDFRRVYPSNELACQILGFVGVDDEGLEGVERQYESVLHGTAGRLIAEKGVGGYPIPGGVTFEEPAVNGQNIVLTIDKDIQYEAHVALQEAVQKHGAKSGSVVIMNPHTGAILAAAST
ncbi:MAG TPA: penicillin-binding protein 2, partial [Coriobacteriia bacterium]|nr:penicillin-binding protein 2 [Coriobacteriia bacterium]